MNEQRKIQLAELIGIGHELFARQPVWENEAFEEEMRAVWEKRIGSKLDDSEQTGAGRTKWRNLVDWVKANFTERGLTFSVQVNRKEYRCWTCSVGQVSGKGLVETSHMQHMVRTLARLTGGQR